MCFKDLTLVPIQTKMINPNLLTAEEEAWLDNYHKQVRLCVGGWDGGVLVWLVLGPNGATEMPLTTVLSRAVARRPCLSPSRPHCAVLLCSDSNITANIQVWEAVSPRLQDKPDVLAWLQRNTAPLKQQLGSGSGATAAAAPAMATA